MNVHGPPECRLLFLLPDLWPAEDRVLFHDPPNREVLAHLVERRTGLRPTFAMPSPWTITVPMPEVSLLLTEEEQAALLERHESRPIPSGQWD